MAYEKEVIKVEKEEIKVHLLKCSICDKEFDRFSSLEVHLLAFHQIFFKGEMSFSFGYCAQLPSWMRYPKENIQFNQISFG